MRFLNPPAYDLTYDDVFLVPNRSSLSSRHDVDLTAPDGTRYAVAVMIGDTRRSIPQRQALMQAVAAAVVASHRSGPTYARTGAADAGTQK